MGQVCEHACVLLGVSFIPPATGINYSSWFAVGFVFQFIIRKRNFAWWSKYNYVTGAALDCGLCLHVAISCDGALMLTDGWVMNRHCAFPSDYFFTLQLPKGGVEVNWWGNSVFENSASLFISFPSC